MFVSENVETVLEKLQVPIPEEKGTFLKGAVGELIFMSPYGVVVRIETHDDDPNCHWERVEHPHMLEPLGTVYTPEAVIEICPGTISETSVQAVTVVKDRMREDGLDYCDDCCENTGYLPIQSVEFPEGFPVVIDRLSVQKLSETPAAIKEAQEKWGNPQKELYAPLREKFQEAWRGNVASVVAEVDPDILKEFWEMCLEFKAEGKLLDGWNTKTPGDSFKKELARRAAVAYGNRYLTAVYS